MWRAGRPTALAAACVALAGCVYFNALYNANRLYERGRKEVRAGNESSGRTALAESIRKAESALERHPDSRWADDALRLIAQARLLRGEYGGAAEAARRLQALAQSEQDRRRAAAFLGRAEARLGEAERADSLLSLALAGRLPGDERVPALAARASARRALGRWQEADADYAEALGLASDDPRLRLARFYLLLDAGDTAGARVEFRRLLTRGQNPTVEDDILAAADSFAKRAPAAARSALAGAAAGPLRNSTRAKLVTLRGRLSLMAGDVDSARAEYERATAIAPRTDGAVAGYVALARLELTRVSSPEDLSNVRDLLSRATSGGAGRDLLEARKLALMVGRVLEMAEARDVAWLAAAELARDTLGAPYLARALFLQFAEELPNSIWAPKALLAALGLGSYDHGAPVEPDDEALRERLRSKYASSPYVLAVEGAEEDGGGSFTSAERALEERMQEVLARLGVPAVRRRPAREADVVEDTLDEAPRRRGARQGTQP